MWASPLYLQNGPGGKGVFFAVTTGNDVFALDETTGATVWTHNIGSSPTANGVSCGNIHPLGIVSTPVIDATSRTIYVAGAVGTTSISDHQVHALSVDDGTERTGWPVSVNLSSGGTTFTPPPQNQRSALSLVAGKLYVAYGGHIGDCGPYHGWVVGIDTSDPTKIGGWASGGQGEGIWAAAGMASDGNGVFALTGNNTQGVTTHLDSEEAVRITGLGTKADTFYPTSWKSMDSGDADLGASNPVYFELSGATPSKILAVVSKDGNLYLLDAAQSGRHGGPEGRVPGGERNHGRSHGRRHVHHDQRALRGVWNGHGRDVRQRRRLGRQINHLGADPAGRAAGAQHRLVRAAVRARHRTDRDHHRRHARGRGLVHEQRQAECRGRGHRLINLHQQPKLLRRTSMDVTNCRQRANCRGWRRQSLRLVSPLNQR